jgi:hypothetical protein
MKLSSHIKAYGISKALEYLDRDPESNLPKLMEWVDLFAGDELFSAQRNVFRSIISDKTTTGIG